MGSSTADGVALGFRVRTGRAVPIVLVGPVNAPKVVARHDLVLSDEAVPESFQPYHATLELSPSQAAPPVRRLSEIVREASLAAVQRLIEDLARAGLEPRAVGIVVGSLTDPSTVKNPNMHAHAAEGRLTAHQGREHTASIPLVRERGMQIFLSKAGVKLLDFKSEERSTGGGRPALRPHPPRRQSW